MLRFLKRKKSDNDTSKPVATEESASVEQSEPVMHSPADSQVEGESLSEIPPEPQIIEPSSDGDYKVAEPIEKKQKKSWFSRLKQGLSKTRHNLAEGLTSLVLGRKSIDDELLEDIETLLLTADVGVDLSARIIKELTKQVARKQLTDPEALLAGLKQLLSDSLQSCCHPLYIEKQDSPYVILMVGINGAGKTTTIGKLAKRLQGQGQKVMLAAGDTFRAAAVEQLQVWGERNDIPVVAQHQGADSASVIFDAFQSAKARHMDVLIADTAGRLHTQQNLMEELKKVKRVMSKIDANAPHEVLLVLDAGIGQNAIMQAQQFNQAVGVSGLVLTKLDGTAKGGIIFAICEQLSIPIRFIGVGEAIEDLRVFDSEQFVAALFAQD